MVDLILMSNRSMSPNKMADSYFNHILNTINFELNATVFRSSCKSVRG